MASKKSGRAAGLAALAGLAYMATRDKGGKEAPSDSSYDALERKRMPAKTEDATESGDFLSRRLKTNPETGKAYSMDNLSPMSSGKSAPASAASAAPAKAPSASESSRFAPSGSPVAKAAAGTGNAKPVVAQGGNRSVRSDMQNAGSGIPGANRSIRSDVSSPSSGPDGGNRSVRSDVSNFSSGPDGGNRSVRSDVPRSGLGGVRRPGTNVNYENEETSDMGMKRGGKVKKMASGGMTSSASSRGDGIASKGKTRCKMY